MRLKYAGIPLLMFIAAVAGWWFASPWWTLKAMRDAAAAHDEPALSAHVDYSALRASLKQEVKQQMVGAGGLGSPGSVIDIVAGTIAGPLIDAAVTPKGVEAMFAAEERPEERGEAAGGRLPRIPTDKERPVLERDGLNQFRVHGRETGSATMVFRRVGLAWKLAGVDLAPSAAR